MSDEEDNQATNLEQEQEQIQTALKPENMRQVKIAMATLAAALIKSVEESEAQPEQRFVKLLDQAYDSFRENSDADPQHVLEVIHWTREMLRGWNPVPGRKSSIFGDEQG